MTLLNSTNSVDDRLKMIAKVAFEADMKLLQKTRNTLNNHEKALILLSTIAFHKTYSSTTGRLGWENFKEHMMNSLSKPASTEKPKCVMM